MKRIAYNDDAGVHIFDVHRRGHSRVEWSTLLPYGRTAYINESYVNRSSTECVCVCDPTILVEGATLQT